MKFSTIIVGTLAAFTTASAVPSLENAERGLDFGKDLIDKINNFPGAKEIKGIFMCIKKDKKWKADYSQGEDGIVTFSKVTPKCCNKAKDAWSKYKDDWSKLAVATFNDPCDGGKLSGMTPENVKRLEGIIGPGH